MWSEIRQSTLFFKHRNKMFKIEIQKHKGMLRSKIVLMYDNYQYSAGCQRLEKHFFFVYS